MVDVGRLVDLFAGWGTWFFWTKQQQQNWAVLIVLKIYLNNKSHVSTEPSSELNIVLHKSLRRALIL